VISSRWELRVASRRRQRDLTYVYDAAGSSPPTSRTTRSSQQRTVRWGTACQVQRIISESNPEGDFDVASKPEILLKVRP